jgi:hypothetical protein
LGSTVQSDQEDAPAPLPIEMQPWLTRARNLNGDLWIYRFPNGYGAAVTRGPYTEGGRERLFTLHVLIFDGDEYDGAFDTPITDDVVGRQSLDEIAALLVRVAALPAISGFNAGTS